MPVPTEGLHGRRINAALSTLSGHLDLELTEIDGKGRYVLDFEAMTEVVNAIEEIGEALDDIEESGE